MNQKTTELRRLYASEVASGDLIPIVDRSEITSPTGETKNITVGDLAQYVVSGGFLQINMPQQGFQTSNGLVFDEGSVPTSGDLNGYCYSDFQALGTDFTLVVRAFVPSTFVTDASRRMLFGVGSSVYNMAVDANCAYIGISGTDLIGYVYDGVTAKEVVYSGFFTSVPDRVFEATLTKDSVGTVKLYVNTTLVGTLTGGATTISNSFVGMGNGQSDTHRNINCTIYEAHVYSAALGQTSINQLFYGGVRNSDSSLIASYISTNLNSGPTQWLDCVGESHLLLPDYGAAASNPSKILKLRFKNDGTSGYLGNGTQRDILPANYVLTHCLVYSPGAPLLSVGSTDAVAPDGASGMLSWNNNRIPLVSASYGRNNLPLLELGVAHEDRSLYVFFSSSAAPCTFSFEGYVSQYGPINYIPPSPTPTPTPTVTVTPSSIVASPTPSPTTTPTPTPTLPAGIYLSSNSFRVGTTQTVYTNDASITTKSRWKLRVKATELLGVEPDFSLEQRADWFNLPSAPLNIPPVGQYRTELYWEEFDSVADTNGNYPSIGTGASTAITMSVATASTFTPPYLPGNDVSLSALSFAKDTPPFIYTGDSTTLTSPLYKLRCKLTGIAGSELEALNGANAIHRSVAWNNNCSEIIAPGVGSWTAEVYGLQYDQYSNLVSSQLGMTKVTMSVAVPTGFVPVNVPSYIATGSNVYLSCTTGSITAFKESSPPYVYTTDAAVLSNAGYRLRCKAFVWDGAAWQEYGGAAIAHRASGWKNQYQTIYAPPPGNYKFVLYWIKYTSPFSTAGAVVGPVNEISVVVVPG